MNNDLLESNDQKSEQIENLTNQLKDTERNLKAQQESYNLIEYPDAVLKDIEKYITGLDPFMV